MDGLGRQSVSKKVGQFYSFEIALSFAKYDLAPRSFGYKLLGTSLRKVMENSFRIPEPGAVSQLTNHKWLAQETYKL